MAHGQDRQRVSGLSLDLYHLDAAYVSWRSGQNGLATFDIYTRTAPFAGAYMVTAGLQPALDFVRDLAFSDEDIAYLQAVKHYDAGFLDELRGYRFAGDIDAIAEGVLSFPDEPLLRVTAPFRHALLLESGLLRAIGISTLIATKAARLVDAAAGRPIADFGYRRAQDPYLATRSAIIGGCASTSYVAGAALFDVPTAGTIPHALVQSFSTEADAFRAVAATLPSYSLLLDTYDVHQAIDTAVEVALEARARYGHQLAAVRLDSGDIVADSKHVRAVLDRAGLRETRVLASDNLNEFRIADLLASGAPLDGFGVGGNLDVGLGTVQSGTVGGTLGAVYKLVWYEGDGDPARIKLAGDKSTWPGRKQVVRVGAFTEDVIQLEQEPLPAGGVALLHPVMTAGEPLNPEPDVMALREVAGQELAALPACYRQLRDAPAYPVRKSAALLALREHAAQREVRG
ncbi:MAG: nicotinate phosphoribosyltransferase [Thermomicrobiales bacterium]|nr:nicotinate phosphoribosyltransferase [Thermomicrobiales bacterium]